MVFTALWARFADMWAQCDISFYCYGDFTRATLYGSCCSSSVPKEVTSLGKGTEYQLMTR